MLITGYLNQNDPTFNTNSFSYKAPAVLDSINIFKNENQTRTGGANFNLNYKHLYDTLGKKHISFDLDAGSFRFDSNDDITSRTQKASGLTPALMQQQQNLTNSYVFSAKLDYVKSVKQTLFETGLKASFSDINNLHEGLVTIGGSNDNQFIYREIILAAYTNFRFQWKNNILQTGLRVEQTISEGDAVTSAKSFKRDYLNLFPNVNYEYKFANSTLSASYTRRIGRPNYAYLNPFKNIRSAFYISSGNPDLMPSFTDNIRIGYKFSNLFLSSSYSHAYDIITDLELQDNTSKIVTNFKSNLSNSDIYRLSISYNNTFFKNLRLNYAGGYTNSNFTFTYNNENINVAQDGYYITLDNSLLMGKGWNIGAFYYLQSKTTYGNRIEQPIWNINLSGSKEILKGKGNLSFSLNDIFFTNITRSQAIYSNLNLTVRSKYDSRTFRGSFVYRFGQSKYENRKRTPGSSEEQRRTL